MSAAIDYDARELDVLAALEERHFWFQVRRRIVIDALRRWFPSARAYLEIGSGTGFIAAGIRTAFPAWRVTASDPLLSPQPIDMRAIPFAAAFDVIGAYDVLEHVEDDALALQQLHAACRPGGGILLTVPQHPFLWSPADDRAQHHRRYRRAELRAKLGAAGFERLAFTSFNTIALPLFILRCLLLRGTGQDVGAAVLPRPVDWGLRAAMEADRRLIGAGIDLPFGASLMVAAWR